MVTGARGGVQYLLQGRIPDFYADLEKGHVVVDTPYIPAEWLPLKPLAHYDVHYDFLKVGSLAI